MAKQSKNIGRQAGHLTAISDTGEFKGTRRILLFKCDCGGTVEKALGNHSWSSTVLSCGKCRDTKGNLYPKIGERFSSLTYVGEPKKYTRESGQKYTKHKFKCDCGNTIRYSLTQVTSRSNKTCGCGTGLENSPRMSSKVRELKHKGKKFGFLTFDRVSRTRSLSDKPLDIFKCDCGKEVKKVLSSLRADGSHHCGVCRDANGNLLPEKGAKFSKLTFIGGIHHGGALNIKQYKFMCDCGNEHYAPIRNVLDGLTRSCGCLKKDLGIQRMNKKYHGKKWGELTFVRHAEKWAGPKPGKNPIALFKCECGETKEVRLGDVVGGKTTCCGCTSGHDGGKSQIGDIYGKLTLIKVYHKSKDDERNVRYGEFLCGCGGTYHGALQNVKHHNITSCGCDREEKHRATSKFTLDIHAFDEITNDVAYWVGFMLADGNLSKNTYAINISLKISDIDHLERFRTFVGGNQNFGVSQCGQVARYSCSSETMWRRLRELGIHPAKSLIAVVPHWAKNNRHFWRGMIDGDGSVTLSNNNISLCGTASVCTSFLDYGKTLITARSEVRSYKENLSVVRFGVGGKESYKLLAELYENAPLHLDRKYENAMRILNRSNQKYSPIREFK